MSRYVIDVKKLDENIETIKKKAGCEIIGVVKGNGYGFGISELALILARHNINKFAVTEIEDISTLRSVLESQDILVMRSTCIKEECEIMAKNNATACIGSLESAEVMNETAKELGVTVKCNLKIDTGMGRYGFLPSEISKAIKCYEFENLEFTGAYTHFPTAFVKDGATKAQLEVFKDTMKKIAEHVGDVGTLHCANSPALFNFDGVSLDAVRIGSAFTGRIISYGKTGLHRIGSLEAEVIDTKTVPKGYTISYGGAYKTKRETKIAVIPFGHYDGFGLTQENERYDFASILRVIKRVLKKNHLYVTINDRQYPIIGHIGLDHCTIDITDSDIKVGDTAKADISPLLVNPKIPRIYK